MLVRPPADLGIEQAMQTFGPARLLPSTVKTAKAYPVLPDEEGQVAALVEGILDKSE